MQKLSHGWQKGSGAGEGDWLLKNDKWLYKIYIYFILFWFLAEQFNMYKGWAMNGVHAFTLDFYRHLLKFMISKVGYFSRQLN